MEKLFEIATQKPLSTRTRRALETAIARHGRAPISWEWHEGPVPLLEVKSAPIRCRILFGPKRAGVFLECPAWMRSLVASTHLTQAKAFMETLFREAKLIK